MCKKIKVFNYFKKNIIIYTIIIFSLSILPILVLGIFCTPSADDYGCGALTHQAWVQTHSLSAVVNAIIEKTSYFYKNWQGTFSSAIFMSINPGFFNVRLSFLVPIIMLALCTFSTIIFYKELFCYYLKCSAQGIIFSLCSILIIFFQLIHSPRDAFFWYNGAIHYIGMQSFFLFTLYFFSRLYRTSKKKSIFLLTVLLLPTCFMIGGANLVTALQAVIMLTLLIALLSFYHRKLYFRFILPALCLYIGFILNVQAPGNNARAGEFTELPPIIAIFNSFLMAGNYLLEWLSPTIIFVFIMLLPLAWNMVKKSTYNFRSPYLVLLSCLCLYAAMFTPSLYATGSVGADRQLNIIQWTLYMLIFVNLIYFLGYLNQLKKIDSPFTILMEKVVYPCRYKISLFSIIIIFFIILLTSDRTTFSSLASLRLLANGEASTYHKEYLDRLEILEDPSVLDVEVPPFSVYPDLLTFSEDFAEDPTNWLNVTGSQYFNKNSIILNKDLPN